MGRGGRGNGWRGGQMGWRGPAAGFVSTSAREHALDALKVQAASLDHALGALRLRIEQLEKPDAVSSGKDPR
jgi:hypothetical protein